MISRRSFAVLNAIFIKRFVSMFVLKRDKNFEHQFPSAIELFYFPKNRSSEVNRVKVMYWRFNCQCNVHWEKKEEFVVKSSEKPSDKFTLTSWMYVRGFIPLHIEFDCLLSWKEKCPWRGKKDKTIGSILDMFSLELCDHCCVIELKFI